VPAPSAAELAAADPELEAGCPGARRHRRAGAATALDLCGTPFAGGIWQELTLIPAGAAR